MNFATIEIGSKAVRMIVGGLIDSSKLHIMERWSAHLCLGDSVFKHGVFPENIFPQLEQTIQGLLLESQIFSQIKVLLYATSAVRIPENCHEVVHSLKTLPGILLRKYFPERKNQNLCYNE